MNFMYRMGFSAILKVRNVYLAFPRCYKAAAECYEKIVWWHLLVAPIILIIGGFVWGIVTGGLLWGLKCGSGVFFLFFEAEGVIGFWAKVIGISLRGAVVLSILCSSYDIFCLFILSNKAVAGLRRSVKANPEKAGDSWTDKFFFLVRAFESRAHVAAAEVEDKVKNLETESDNSRFARAYRWFKRRKLLYATLPIFGFVVGALFIGVPLSVVCGLNQLLSFVLIVSGNALKMIAAGYTVLKIGMFGVILSVVAVAFAEKAIKFCIRKWRHRHLQHKKGLA